MKEFDVIISKDEFGAYVVFVPALPGCHSQGNTKKECLVNIKNAIEFYLQVLNKEKLKPKKYVYGILRHRVIGG